MKRVFWLLIFSGAFFFTGCSTVSTSYDYDKCVDFSQYREYAWLDDSAQDQGDYLETQRIKNAVDEQLYCKGFVKSETSPDFLIAISGYTERVRDVIDRGYRYSAYRTYWYQDRFDYIEYDEANTTIEFLDCSTKKVLWRGDISSIVNPSLKPERREAKANKAVGKVLAKFPPN